LIADLSTDTRTQQVVGSFHSSKVKVFAMSTRGKARGLNFIAKKTNSDILAYTDDDCIVGKDWLKQISEIYTKFPQLAGIFGNTYPYQPELHPGENCPSTFAVKKFIVHKFNNFNYYSVGLGNNMSIRSSVLENIGSFREWLGGGALAGSGEESEIIFRTLKHGHTLATNPKMVIFHNRWLNNKDERLLQNSYTKGFIAFLNFYLFSVDHHHAFKFILITINEKALAAFTRSFGLFIELSRSIYYLFLEVFAVLSGICIGLFMAVLNKIFLKK